MTRNPSKFFLNLSLISIFFILGVTLLSVFLTNNNQDLKIPLINSDGVYKVWVSIGNEKLLFIFDSGASETLISRDLFEELISNGNIGEFINLQQGVYTMANGQAVLCDRVLVNAITIDNYKIKDLVIALQTTNAEPLLGKNALDKLGHWSINSKNNILSIKQY